MPELAQASQLTLIDDTPAMRRWARLSPCGTYRYLLGRSWGVGPRVLWVGLNPSTADADLDDPTVRRMVGFSRAWGFGSLELVNLFAYRATEPGNLLALDATAKRGPHADYEILCAAERAYEVVVCWGSHLAGEPDRVQRVLDLLAPHRPVCLGTTKVGAPKHPLYLRADTAREPWGGP